MVDSQLLLTMDYSILLSPSLITKCNRLAFVMLILRIELGLLCHGLGNNTYIFQSHRPESVLHSHRVFRETLTSMPRVLYSTKYGSLSSLRFSP